MADQPHFFPGLNIKIKIGENFIICHVLEIHIPKIYITL